MDIDYLTSIDNLARYAEGCFEFQFPTNTTYLVRRGPVLYPACGLILVIVIADIPGPR
jgi:hypothetical protein